MKGGGNSVCGNFNNFVLFIYFFFYVLVIFIYLFYYFYLLFFFLLPRLFFGVINKSKSLNNIARFGISK